MELVSYTAELVTRAAAGHDTTTLEADDWRVRTLELRESIDEPFALSLTMLTEDTALNVETLVGADLTLSMHQPECDHGHAMERIVRGVVTSAVYVGTFDDKLQMELFVRPSLALADLVQRSRIFEQMTVPEIVTEMATEHLGSQGSVDVSRLRHAHSTRDYCVQFRETDLDFMQRILAEDGLAFLIKQDPDKDAQALVLVDDGSGYYPAGLSLEHLEPSAPVGIPVVTGVAARVDAVCLSALELRRSASTATHQARANDWMASAPAPIEATTGGETPKPWEFGEAYRHAFRRTLEANGTHLDETDRIATVLHQQAQTRSSRAFGHSNALGFHPGGTFAAEGHPAEELNREFLLTAVIHTADCPEADDGGHAGSDGGANYTNRFEALPHHVPYQPQERPKPRAFGQQTATVLAGPGSPEIYTDEHGRIKVWMHWDRSGPEAAAEHSCWLRVAQSLAGNGFGTLFLPRVGMEVLVSFVDGDPDRPVCVGCLYNGLNRPPYELPAERTKSTIKTQSSPGTGSNELRFEDKAGQEQVYLHAQRNLDEQVDAAHTMSVGSTQSVSVGAQQTVTVGDNRELTVKGNQTITVQGTPSKGVPEGQTLTVTGDIKTSATKNITLVALEGIQLICGASHLDITPQGITIQAGGGASVCLTTALVAAATGGQVQLEMSDSGVASLASKQGGGMKIDTDVGLSSAGGSDLHLDAEVRAVSDGKAELVLSGDAKMKGNCAVLQGSGGKVTLDSNAHVLGQSACIESAGGKIDANMSGVKLEGATVQVKGIAKVSVQGTIVGINA